MLHVTDNIAIDEAELMFQFIRSSGPGGQNVNKVATTVQLRFDASSSPSLPEPVRERLLRIAGSRATEEGVILITARRHRSQDQNRKDAVERLVALVQKAANPPKKRRPTRPGPEAARRRLDDKRKRSETKRKRGGVRSGSESED